MAKLALVPWQLQQCASRMSAALQVLCTFGDELLLLGSSWVEIRHGIGDKLVGVRSGGYDMS